MSVYDLPQVFRTPNAPGADPNCAMRCPDRGGAVYGFAFEFNSNLVGPAEVYLEPPWVLMSATTQPFCRAPQYKTDVTTCYEFDPGVNGTNQNPYFYIVTEDPNAPARNIVIQQTMGCP